MQRRSLAQEDQDFPPDDAALFDRYGPVIFAYVLKHVPSREDAEDLTLEVFTAALEKKTLNRLPAEEQLTWLKRVTHNKLIDTYRKAQHRILPIVTQVNKQGPREIYLYKTADGGKNWSPLGARIEDSSRSLLPVEMIDTNHHLLWSLKNSLAMYVFVNDQWRQRQIAPISGDVNLKSFSFINSQHGWVFATRQSGTETIGTLYMTGDGAQSWHELTKVVYPTPIMRG